jgi:predicted dehydrogenase
MSSLSRRGFLHTSVGIAAAVTAGSALAAGAQDKPDEKPAAEAAAAKDKPQKPEKAAGDAAVAPGDDAQKEIKAFPKDKIRVLVMGCGGRGGSHVDAYAGKDDSVVVALCDPDQRRMESYAKRVGEKQPGMPEPHMEQDVRKLLEDKDIDVVSIATCNHWHALGAIWAIQAGKDVYVEKPCSHNVSEGRRIVEFARRHNRIVQHGTQSRSDGAVRAAIDFIHQGGIGKLQLARALCYKRRPTIGDTQGPQPIPPEIDYNLWLGPAPEKPLEREHLHYDWHYFWDYGNGDIGNQGVHQMDIAAWGLSAKELPRAVQSAGGRLGYKDDGETPNTLLSLYDYGDAGKLLFEVRGLETEKVLNVNVGNIFYGTEGYVVIGPDTGPAAYTPDGEKMQSLRGSGRDHFANFIKAVKSRKMEDLNAEIAIGHVSAALCHLGNVSYRVGSEKPLGKDDLELLGGNDAAARTWHRTRRHLEKNGVDLAKENYVLGKALTIDPRAEQFTGEGAAEANPLLTRKYRQPFVVPDKIA